MPRAHDQPTIASRARDVAKLAVGAALRARVRRSGRRVGAAVLYHGISGGDRPAGQELVPTVAAAVFARHVRHLARRYRVVAASRLPAAAAGRRAGDPLPISITFDDDHPSYVPLVVPVLERERAVATFFLSGASLERPHWFPWEHLQAAWDHGLMESFLARMPEPVAAAGRAADRPLEAISRSLTALPLDERSEAERILESLVGGHELPERMSSEHVRALAAAGQEIGFHTRSHPHLTELSDAELDAALVDGRAELEAVVGRPVTVLAYPFGDWDGRVADAARRAGFDLAFTADREPVRPSTPPHAVGRIGVPQGGVAALSMTLARVLSAD